MMHGWLSKAEPQIVLDGTNFRIWTLDVCWVYSNFHMYDATKINFVKSRNVWRKEFPVIEGKYGHCTELLQYYSWVIHRRKYGHSYNT